MKAKMYSVKGSFEAVQWTGSNATEVLEFHPQVVIRAGKVYPYDRFRVEVGEWLVKVNGHVIRFTQEEFDNTFIGD